MVRVKIYLIKWSKTYEPALGFLCQENKILVDKSINVASTLP